MRSVTDIIDRFKQNWTKELSPDAIDQACRDAGMEWHDSILNPIVTIQIFFMQVLHGNTAIEHLSHLTGMTFTAAAYCKARMRVQLKVLRTLLERCVEQLQQETFETARPSRRHVGLGIACFMLMDRVSRCRTLLHFKLTSASLGRRKQDAVFPLHIGWSCCTPAQA